MTAAPGEACDWVALVDESSDGHTYRVGALLLPQDAVPALNEGLEDAMRYAEEHFGVASSTELHAHRIFHALEGWRPLAPRQRIAVYHRAIDAVAASGGGVFLRGVQIDRLRAKPGETRDPYEASLTFVIESIDEHVRPLGGSVQVIADDSRFAKSACEWLAVATEWSLWGSRGQRITNVTAIEFVDSAKSRPVQAIDLVTYLKTRIASGVETDRRAIKENGALWRKIAPLVRIDQVWFP